MTKSAIASWFKEFKEKLPNRIERLRSNLAQMFHSGNVRRRLLYKAWQKTSYYQSWHNSRARSLLIRRLSIPIILLLAVNVVGTVGYYLMWHDEGGSWSDALYMMFITITTIGFAEVRTLGAGERLFTMVISLLGIGSLSYVIGTTMEHLVAAQVADVQGRRKMREYIDSLTNHVIVAGFGQMGKQIARELDEQSRPFVVVDIHEDREEEAQEENYLYILGDASEEEVLEQAGIYRAKGLIAAANSDASNAFIIMTARSMCPELFIIVRAESDTADKKLMRAGANQVINPYVIGSRRMVNYVVRPSLLSLAEMNMKDGNDVLRLEEIEILPKSTIADNSLRFLNLRNRCGVNVMAVIRNDKVMTPPDPDMQLVVGDHLLVLGTQTQFAKLQDIEITDVDAA